MIYKPKGFNPKRDKKAVDQFGFVDIVKIMDTNTLPAVSAEGSEVYNGIDDPSSILGKPTDVFDAMRMEASIKDYKPDSGAPKAGDGVKQSDG